MSCAQQTHHDYVMRARRESIRLVSRHSCMFWLWLCHAGLCGALHAQAWGTRGPGSASVCLMHCTSTVTTCIGGLRANDIRPEP